MPNRSAGIVLFRHSPDGIEVLAVHPGGPFWANKDQGAWSIPKGEHGLDEDPLLVARREFAEELGSEPPDGVPIPLGEVSQAGGKRVMAWAIEGDLDVSTVCSNEFQIEWPPRSGNLQSFPEVDRAEWFPIGEASERLNHAQVEFLERLVEIRDWSG